MNIIGSLRGPAKTIGGGSPTAGHPFNFFFFFLKIKLN
jgi:hypothetical protein